MPRNFLLFLLPMLLAGCASAPRRTLPHPVCVLPAEALVTQRGVLSVMGKQFTLNGYLATSASRGRRLIVTENFGHVLADVLIKKDGRVFVMQATPAFKPAWIRRYIAADVQSLFGENQSANDPAKEVGPGHFIIKHFWYNLDLHIVETKPGPQAAELFDETPAAKP